MFILISHDFIIFYFLVQMDEIHKIVNEKGCMTAGEEWLENNLLLVAGVSVGIAFLQVKSS